jgi:hypothetical protein
MEIPHSWAFDREDLMTVRNPHTLRFSPGVRVLPFRDTHGMVSVICGVALTCCPREKGGPDG